MSKPPLGSAANTDYSIDVNSFRDGKLSIEQQIEIYGQSPSHDRYDMSYYCFSSLLS